MWNLLSGGAGWIKTIRTECTYASPPPHQRCEEGGYPSERAPTMRAAKKPPPHGPTSICTFILNRVREEYCTVERGAIRELRKYGNGERGTNRRSQTRSHSWWETRKHHLKILMLSRYILLKLCSRAVTAEQCRRAGMMVGLDKTSAKHACFHIRKTAAGWCHPSSSV